MKVATGDNVKVHYRGTLTDGTEFDNSHNRGTPLEFTIGSGQMIVGFNDAVIGMSEGEKKTFSITPEMAYGQRIEEAVQAVPRQTFSEDFEFEVGGMIQGNGPRGPFVAKIKEFDDDMVTLDLNHPLAGEELSFEVELVSHQTSL
jgi:peptidylprolyl isomerase